MSVILVPFDGSAHAFKALSIAMDLGDKYKAGVAVITIAGPTRDEEAFKAGGEIIKKAAAKMAQRKQKPAALEVEFGTPSDCIIAAGKRHGASTIVMGCRGAASSEDTFGSVSQAVFRKADCTCISVK